QFGGLLAFGERWLREAEPFSVFFRVVSWLAPVGARVPRPASGAGEPLDITVTFPALRLLRTEVSAASLAAFILLVLASVSVDALSLSLACLGLLGENPLDYPGRTALIVPNTLGLLGVFAALVLAYVAAARLVISLAGLRLPPAPLLARFALPLIPIACGYHF